MLNEIERTFCIDANITHQKKTIGKFTLICLEIYQMLDDKIILNNAERYEDLKLLVDMLFDYLYDMRKDNEECSEYAKKLKDMLKARVEGGAEKCI